MSLELWFVQDEKRLSQSLHSFMLLAFWLCYPYGLPPYSVDLLIHPNPPPQPVNIKKKGKRRSLLDYMLSPFCHIF